MTNESPTPEMVEKAKAQLSWVNKIDFGGDRDPPDVVAVRTLLAHIAALKTELSEEIRIGDARAEREGRLRDKVSKLEAENKRMSEELATYRRNDKSGIYSNRSKDED